MADCAGLATKGDIENIYALIAQLGDKIPDNLATKEDIAGISSQLAQINQRLSAIENKQAQQDQDLANIKNSQLAIQNDVGGLPSWISNAIEGIKDFFQGIISGVSEAISGVYNWLSDRAQWLWEKMGDVAGFLAEKVGDVYNWISDRAQWIWDKVTDAAGFLAEKVGDVYNWISDRASWLWQKIDGMGEGLFQKMIEIADWVGDRAFWLWNLISGALSPIKTNTETTLSRLDILDNIFDSVAGLADRIWNFIKDAASGIKDYIFGLLGDYKEYIEGISRWLYDALANLFGNRLDLLYAIIEKCDYIIYLLVYGDNGSGTGDGGGSTNPTEVNLTPVIDLINQLKADFLRLNNWVCGGLTLAEDAYQFEAIFEGKLNGALSTNFNADLTEGIEKTVNNLSDLVLNYLCVLYGRAGFQDYPISVPALPLTPGAEPLSIVTASRFQSWQTKFIDNGIGAFPFEIKVKDSDLIKVGNQEITLKFPNIAETLAEIYGLLTVNKALTEANTNIGVKSLGELGALRKQGYLSYKLTAAIVSYLGFKTKQKKEKIKLSFNPLVGVDGNEDSFSKALTPKEVDVIVEVEDEKKSLEEKLAIVLQAAAIIRAVHFEKLNDDNLSELKDFYKGIEEDSTDKQDFDNFVEEYEQGFITRANLTDPINPYGRTFDRRPKVRELGDQADQQQ